MIVINDTGKSSMTIFGVGRARSIYGHNGNIIKIISPWIIYQLLAMIGCVRVWSLEQPCSHFIESSLPAKAVMTTKLLSWYGIFVTTHKCDQKTLMCALLMECIEWFYYHLPAENSFTWSLNSLPSLISSRVRICQILSNIHRSLDHGVVNQAVCCRDNQRWVDQGAAAEKLAVWVPEWCHVCEPAKAQHEVGLQLMCGNSLGCLWKKVWW